MHDDERQEYDAAADERGAGRSRDDEYEFEVTFRFERTVTYRVTGFTHDCNQARDEAMAFLQREETGHFKQSGFIEGISTHADTGLHVTDERATRLGRTNRGEPF